ncbi:MAG: purine permease [Gemmatimonadetes bacterium]|nr:purine permease [Gemmatimonadota bacterium]
MGSPVVYGIEDRPPLKEALPLGVQHMLAMLLSNVTIPLIIVGSLGLAAGDTALIVQMALFMAGAATLVQTYPIGPVGGRIPVIMGTSVAFVGASVAIGQEFGLASVFGACLVASLVEVALGFSIVPLRKLFPPLVTGVVLMLIGLTLIPVGMDYAAGGVGASDYGSLPNLGIAAVVFVLTLGLNQYGRGFVKYTSVLIAVIVGYVLALVLGKVTYAGIATADWFSLPRPLALGLEFHWGPILLMGFIYVISAMETIGDISGIVAAAGRDPTTSELRGGLVADGVMSGLAALFSTFPNTSYSQNVGLVNFTGVVSRHVAAIAGIMLVALGIVPKVGAAFATIPAPVIGGGGLMMFAMIFASGAAIVHRGTDLNQRNMVILAAAIGLGLGVELRPDAIQALPQGLQSLFGSGLITGGLTALILNAILPEE